MAKNKKTRHKKAHRVKTPKGRAWHGGMRRRRAAVLGVSRPVTSGRTFRARVTDPVADRDVTDPSYLGKHKRLLRGAEK